MALPPLGSLPPVDEFMELLNLAICNTLALKKEELISGTRKRYIVQARYMGFAICKEAYDDEVSLGKIGNNFGGKDHATVIYGLRTHGNDMKRSDYGQTYVKLKNNFIILLRDTIKQRDEISWPEIQMLLEDNNVPSEKINALRHNLSDQLLKVVTLNKKYVNDLLKKSDIKEMQSLLSV
jgi:hypothetical protein